MEKKKIKLPIIIVICVVGVLLLVGGLLVSGLDTSSGRCVVADNGSILWVDKIGNPVRLIDRTWFGMPGNLSTGDEIWLVHANAVAESYPGQVVTYFCVKTGEGTISDIPEDTVNSLKELEWIKSDESISNVGGVDDPTDVTITEKLLISSDEYYDFLLRTIEEAAKDSIFEKYSIGIGEYPYYESVFVVSEAVDDDMFYSEAERIAKRVYEKLIVMEYEAPTFYQYSYNTVTVEFYTEAYRNSGANCAYHFTMDEIDRSKTFEENTLVFSQQN